MSRGTTGTPCQRKPVYGTEKRKRKNKSEGEQWGYVLLDPLQGGWIAMSGYEWRRIETIWIREKHIDD